MQLRLYKLFFMVMVLMVGQCRSDDSISGLSPALKNFLVQSYRYHLNAPWLIEDFSHMNFNDFSAAWSYIVGIMKNPQERWRFFCNSAEEYNKNDYHAKWIWQCHFFELWLSKLFVCIEDFSLVYDSQGKYQSDKNYAHIYTCWQTLMENDQGDYSAIYDFFAFYADCLSFCLLQGVTTAYLEMGSPIYDSAWQKSYSIAEGLKVMISMLQKSDYAPRYAAQLERYNQILELLKQEKLKHLLAR